MKAALKELEIEIEIEASKEEERVLLECAAEVERKEKLEYEKNLLLSKGKQSIEHQKSQYLQDNSKISVPDVSLQFNMPKTNEASKGLLPSYDRTQSLLSPSLHFQKLPSDSFPSAYNWHDTRIPKEINRVSEPNRTNSDSQLDNVMKMMAVMQLPATQLLTFDGSPLQYWSFIYSFEEIVGSKYVDDSKKLNTLFSYCTGKAAKSIECCKFMNAEIGYRQALQILKQRFGDPLLIKEYWIEQLTMGVKLKPRDADALQNLADEVLNCSSTFIAMGLNLDEFYDKVSTLLEICGNIGAKRHLNGCKTLPHITHHRGFFCFYWFIYKIQLFMVPNWVFSTLMGA